MAASTLHRFEQGGRRFVVDTETCFCFECDDISWAVLDHYPHTPVNRILHLVGEAHPVREVEEVIGELEWLRSTKSILPAIGQKERLKQFELLQELHRVDVQLDSSNDGVIARNISGATALLLGRSGTRKDLLLRIRTCDSVPEGLVAPVNIAFSEVGRAGKSLKIELEAPLAPSGRDARSLAGHEVTVSIALAADDVGAQLTALRKALGKSLAAVAGLGSGAAATLTPKSTNFTQEITGLRSAGFTRIDIDVPGAYARNADLDPAAMLSGMQSAAVYYAQQLHEGNYFRLEPIASVFHQIYEGAARPRSDGSGTNELALDGNGAIYPSRYFLGQEPFKIGSLDESHLDEDRRGAFDDLGSLTTSPCSQCWARNLCGGGHSAIHAALGGGIRTPDAAWCESQREWFASAIAAFNLLSAHGVNFARLYANLGQAAKPSLWQAAKAAITMKVGLRPIEEGDAALLTKWENWSGAAYFVGNEYGMFLATQYDREMDSLHPRGIEQEMVIVSRRGDPLGLLKIRPDLRLDLARVWIFLRDAQLYRDASTRKGFERLLAQAASQESCTTLLAAAGPGDPGLGDFLEAVGFEPAGRNRDALFLHDAYHDLAIYQRRLQ